VWGGAVRAENKGVLTKPTKEEGERNQATMNKGSAHGVGKKNDRRREKGGVFREGKKNIRKQQGGKTVETTIADPV